MILLKKTGLDGLINQGVSLCTGHSSLPPFYPQLAVDIPQVPFYRVFRDKEFRRDFRIFQISHQQRQDLYLLASEAKIAAGLEDALE